MAGDIGMPEGESPVTQFTDPMQTADMPDSMKLKSQQEDREEQQLQQQQAEKGGLIKRALKKLGIGQGPKV